MSIFHTNEIIQERANLNRPGDRTRAPTIDVLVISHSRGLLLKSDTISYSNVTFYSMHGYESE